MDIVSVSLLTGFFGDFILQLLTKYTNLGGKTGWGLIPYFSQHGSIEALFTAAGMMGIFYVIYLYVLRLPLNYIYLAIFGVLLDFIFRKMELFPSLDGYYRHLNYFWSVVWGAIPMIMPLFFHQFLI